MHSVSPARKAAFEILLEVERGRAHSDDLLRAKNVAALSAEDRNLATALVLGALRWQILLDEQCKEFLARPGAKLDREVLIALRLGAFQLLHLDRVPAHAAIDDSVELAKQARYSFAARMVNAVLRKMARDAGQAKPSEDSQESALRAHPAWMVERWKGFYGPEAARAICVHGQEQPAAVLRLADRDAEEELVQSGIQLEPGRLLNAARVVSAGDVPAKAAFREGRVRMQDEGSQLVAEFAGAQPGTKVNSVLDACAAPGGRR